MSRTVISFLVVGEHLWHRLVIFLTMNLLFSFLSYTVHFRRRLLWVSHIYMGFLSLLLNLWNSARETDLLLVFLCTQLFLYISVKLWLFILCFVLHFSIYFVLLFIPELVDVFHLTSIFDIFVGSLLIETFLTLGYYMVFQPNFSPALYSAVSSNSPGLCYQRQIPKNQELDPRYS